MAKPNSRSRNPYYYPRFSRDSNECRDDMSISQRGLGEAEREVRIGELATSGASRPAPKDSMPIPFGGCALIFLGLLVFFGLGSYTINANNEAAALKANAEATAVSVRMFNPDCPTGFNTQVVPPGSRLTDIDHVLQVSLGGRYLSLADAIKQGALYNFDPSLPGGKAFVPVWQKKPDGDNPLTFLGNKFCIRPRDFINSPQTPTPTVEPPSPTPTQSVYQRIFDNPGPIARMRLNIIGQLNKECTLVPAGVDSETYRAAQLAYILKKRESDIGSNRPNIAASSLENRPDGSYACVDVRRRATPSK